MRAFLKKIIPAFLIDLYRKKKKHERQSRRERVKAEGKSLGPERLKDEIVKCGINKGDVLMLHSSLSSLGHVEGGAETVVNAFLDVLGNSGTLMMPSFPGTGFTYDYLETNPVFDMRSTPSKMGAITEYFRKKPAVLRSFHPTEPVCALGPDAHFLTSGHFGQLTPYNEKSPFYRLCERKGKIMMLGVDLNSLTNLHTLEDAVENFRYPVYHGKIFTCRMKDGQGREAIVKTKCHDPAWSRKRKCNALIPHFKRAGLLRECRIGLAQVMLINAREMHEWMVKSYHEKGITMYTPNGKE